MGLDEETASKIACGFGAGMGRQQEVCGAVTGGIMAIGLKFGNISGDDRELIDRFTQKRGSCSCRKLLNGCDLSTENGQRKFREQDLHTSICRECVKSAVEIVGEMV